MINKIIKYFFITVLLFWSLSLFSQNNTDTMSFMRSGIDSIFTKGIIYNANRKKPEIKLSPDQAVRFLKNRFKPRNWNNISDPFRLALGQLIYKATYPPFDSSEYLLKRYPYDSINISWDKFYIWEPLHLKVPFVTLPEIKIPVDSMATADTDKIKIITDSLDLSKLKLDRSYNCPCGPPGVGST